MMRLHRNTWGHVLTGTMEILKHEPDIWDWSWDSSSDPPPYRATTMNQANDTGANSKSILDDAREIVNGSRQTEYNDPVENHVREAIVATVTLGKPMTPAEIVKIMHGKKLVRSGRGYKHDNVVDKAGYAEIEDRVERAMKDGTVQKIVEKLLGGWVEFGPKPLPTFLSGSVVGVTYHHHPGTDRIEARISIDIDNEPPSRYFSNRVAVVKIP